MKLDPGMHIGLHLVFFGKSGVTTIFSNHKSCPLKPTREGDEEDGYSWKLKRR
jgi:hypothetical protein